MSNKEFIQSLIYIRGLLYRCPFGGDQMMVASECVRTIDALCARLNERAPDQDVGAAVAATHKEGKQ